MIPEDLSSAELADAARTRCRPSLEMDSLRDQLVRASQLLAELPTFPTEPSLVFRRPGRVRAEAVVIAGGITIGRGEGCEIRLQGREELSRRHFAVRRHNADYVAEDFGSCNGTQVHGAPVSLVQRVLCDGDLIQAGGVVFLFVRGGE